jgi:hypothetical protein
VISGLWRDELAEKATRLRFIQSIGAGTDQFGRDVLSAKGIRLASASGRQHESGFPSMRWALILALARRLPEARDHQSKRYWRGMIGDLTKREDEKWWQDARHRGPGQDRRPVWRTWPRPSTCCCRGARDPAAGKGAADSVRAFAI